MMDTSETYIKMSDCEEIQELKARFIFLSNSWHEHLILCSQSEEYFGDYFWVKDNPKRTIWLPRQDQLQILSELTWVEFDDKCRVYWFKDGRRETTKEQAGIRVVMKELHGKVWNGEAWQKQDC